MEMLTHLFSTLGISQEDIDKAMRLAEEHERTLLDQLREMSLITHREYAEARAHREGVRHVRLVGKNIHPDDMARIPEPFSRSHRLIAYGTEGDRIQIAMEDISSDILERIGTIVDTQFDIALTDADSISYALGTYQAHLREHYGDKIAGHARRLIPLESYIHHGESLPSRYISELQESFDAHKISELLLHVGSSMRAQDIYIDRNTSSTDVSQRFGGGSYPTMKLDRHIFDRLLWVYFKQTDISLSSLRTPLHSTKLPTDIEGISATITFITTGAEVSHIHIALQETDRLFPTMESLLPSKIQSHLVHAHITELDLIVLGDDDQSTKRTYYALLEELHRREKRVVSFESALEVNIPGVTQLNISKKDDISSLLSSHPVIQSETIALYDTTYSLEVYKRLFFRTHGNVIARYKDLKAYIALRDSIKETRRVLIVAQKKFKTVHDPEMRTLTIKEKKFFTQVLKDSHSSIDLAGQFASNTETKRSRNTLTVTITGVSTIEDIAHGSLYEKSQRRVKASVVEHALMRSSQGDVTIEEIVRYITGQV